MVLLDVGYGGTDDVHIILHRRGGPLIDNQFLPYIYLIPKKKTKVVAEGIVKIEEVEKRDLKGPIKALKIFFKHPKYVVMARDNLKELGDIREMDIPLVRRYMIDRGLKPLFEVTPDFKLGKKEVDDLKVLAFDIETLSETGMDIGNNPVIMISMWGEGFKKVISWGKSGVKGMTVVADEAELIREFLKTVEEFAPEVVVSYNGDGFDWPSLNGRAKTLGVNFKLNGKRIYTVKRGRERPTKLNGMINVDLYQFIRNILSPYMQSETLRLNAVASELIGKEKVKIGGAKGIDEAWKNDPALLYEYSLQDSKITYELAQEVLPMIYVLSKIVGQNIFDVARMTPGQIVEWLLAKESFEEGMIVPNRPKHQESLDRRRLTYEGAFVKEPIKGLHSPVAVCDFRSLYPTIIMAHNISPDTINCKHTECKKNVSPDGDWFCKKKEGFIPKRLRQIFEARMKLKKKARTMPKGQKQKIVDTEQKALKLILNSFYGYLGYANARWYNLESARAIASWGRDYIIKIMKDASMADFTVVYGDTDSIMITSTSDSFEDDVKKFLGEINKGLPDPMELELEDFFVRGLFVTKKRYGLLSKEGNLVVKGLEKVRRDWSKVAREAQGIVLRLVLENKVDAAKAYVKKLVTKIRGKEIPMEKLVIKTQLTKRIENYNQVAPHVKVAKDLQQMGTNVFPGMIVEYIVTPGKGTISGRSKPASMAKEYDADYYIENQMMPAVMRVLDAVGTDEKELMMKQSDLGEFI